MSYVKNLRLWLRSLLAAVITGGCTAALSALGVTAANAAGLQITAMSLDQLVTTAVSGGVVGALAYLQRSPLPKLDADEPVVSTQI